MMCFFNIDTPPPLFVDFVFVVSFVCSLQHLGSLHLCIWFLNKLITIVRALIITDDVLGRNQLMERTFSQNQKFEPWEHHRRVNSDFNREAGFFFFVQDSWKEAKWHLPEDTAHSPIELGPFDLSYIFLFILADTCHTPEPFLHFLHLCTL